MKIVAIKARKLSINRCFYSLNQKKTLFGKIYGQQMNNITFFLLILLPCTV